MNVGTLFGLDPAGTEVMWLCVLAALAVSSLIVGGFVLLWRAGRNATQQSNLARHGLWEFGLRTLWQLGHTARRHTVRPPVTIAERVTLDQPPQ